VGIVDGLGKRTLVLAGSRVCVAVLVGLGKGGAGVALAEGLRGVVSG
jgi:hypothetical protein